MLHVLEGSITTEQLAVELEKLLPVKHNWVIEEKGKDAITTNFPSADWLEIMVNWGPMDTKAVKGKIRFEKCTKDDAYKYEIEKVWVQFRRLPLEFRKFPIIWAIASILGVPRAVDTRFTQKHGRARMKVVVLDPSLIPVFMDVVIGDFAYQLHFGVEQGHSDAEPGLLDFDSTIEVEDPKEGEADGDADPNKDPKDNIDHYYKFYFAQCFT